MNINGKWYSEPELAAYIADLESRLRDRDLEADNGARQIAHYEDELRQAKELLKAAVEEINQLINDDGVCHIEHSCEDCPFFNKTYDDCKWQHKAEALALIEGGRDVFATDTNVGGKGGAENAEN